MKRAAGALATMALLGGVALGQTHCGGSDVAFGPGAAGGAADGGSANASGGMGGSAGAGGTGGAGGSATCESFGDPCTECAVDSSCSDAYCGCLASASCSAAWQCFIGCTPGDDACADGCEMDHAEGYADFLLLTSCLGSECSGSCGSAQPLGGCPTCLLTDCEAEMEACVADAECNEYLDCVTQCSGPGCLSECYEELSDTTLADAIASCNQTHCQDEGECGGGGCQPLGDACTQCAYDACNAKYCGCYSDPDCSGYGQCAMGCAMGDDGCNDSCEATYADGYAQYYQLVDCMGSSCETDCGFGSLPPCFSCITNSCAAELNTCVGDAECNAYLDCTAQCQTPACNQQCYAQLTDTTEADALSSCIQSSCSTECGGMMP